MHEVDMTSELCLSNTIVMYRLLCPTLINLGKGPNSAANKMVALDT